MAVAIGAILHKLYIPVVILVAATLMLSACGGGGGNSCTTLPGTKTFQTYILGLYFLQGGSQNSNDNVILDTRTLTASPNTGSIADAGHGACFGSVRWPGGGQTGTIKVVVGEIYIVQFADGTYLIFQVTSDVGGSLSIMVAYTTQL